MNKTELLEILNRLEMHPSRKLGQNFLLDPNMLNALVSAAHPEPGQRVLEIGPGLGMLTRPLLDAGVELTCVELDHRLAEYNRQEFGNRPNFRLIEGDACKQDFDTLMGDTPYRCIANLPYSCSTPFLSHIIAGKNIPTDLYVLLQLEMAERLAAPPKTREYGAPTVKIALRYQTKILRHVPGKVFFPPPEVESAFVCFTQKELCESDEIRQRVGEIVTALFLQRRKKAGRQLQNRFRDIDAAACFRAAGLDPDIRPDSITVPAYIALARATLQFQQQKQNSDRKN